MKQFVIAVVLVLMAMGTGLDGNKTIHGVTEPWAPYFAPDLDNQGPFVEIAKEAFKRAGYDLQVEFIPWNRAVELSKRGQKDALLGAYFSDERAKVLAYTDQIMTASDVLFAKKDRNISYASLKDLSEYKIGVVKGAAHGKAFDEADYLNKQSVQNREQNIKKLAHGRVDLMAGPKDVTFYEMQKNSPELVAQVEALSPPLNKNNVHICISKKRDGYDAIVAAFNGKLAEMKADGSYAAIMKKHGIQ